MDDIYQQTFVNRECNYCGVALIETFPKERGSDGSVQWSIYMNVMHSYFKKVKDKPRNYTDTPPNNDTLNTPTKNNKLDLNDELEEALAILEQGK